MGEVAKRTEEEQVQIEDSVLALSEAGWTQRDITKELGISFKSIKPYKQRALSRIEIPDSEAATQEDIVFYDAVIREALKMLEHPQLGPAATNRPQLLRQIIDARKARSKAVKDHNDRQQSPFGGGTLYEMLMGHHDVDGMFLENRRAVEAWTERGQDVDVNALEQDPADGVYKLPSEFIQGDEDAV